MTELQVCEFDILKNVASVCEKMNIRFFMVCGSALGAVKYNGFIPWDDDIDIGMFREDYKRFLIEAPALLPKHLFIQNHKTEGKYPFIYTKVRDSRTTYIEKNVSHLHINHGVYIDVFPLDGYPASIKEQKKFEKKKRIYKILSECSCNFKRSRKYEMLTKVLRMFGICRYTQRILHKYDALISKYPTKDSEVICNHGNWQGKKEYSPKKHYGNGVSKSFEGLNVFVPEYYDSYLTQKYGDWRADLPKEQMVGHHFYEICDLNKPYTEYI